MELLVVISIIAVLLGVLLPTLGRAKDTGRIAQQLASARELMRGYLLYADEHQGYVLPALVEAGQGPDAIHESVVDHAGRNVQGQPLKRYLWRLAPYMDYNFGVFYRDKDYLDESLESITHLTDTSDTSSPAYLDYYGLSVYPSFGINSLFVGGESQFTSDQFVQQFAQLGVNIRGTWISKISDARRPSSLFTLVSAAAIENGTFFEGYFKVTAPYFTTLSGPKWQDFGLPTRDGAVPEKFGHVWPVAGSTTVAGLLDGHAASFNWEETQDMRHWADGATHTKWRVGEN